MVMCLDLFSNKLSTILAKFNNEFKNAVELY
ncbi:hypothetical protein NF27_DR00170 [Candidatus Jidaibacter acanthamoeba]|uniref:Uncharacterized protein n=1 Tax=Candidatus Jidaibacter acanthamoebae TaxID=86105 RepID=A0A0C1MTN7_9RICK|nr:hypothetical protein NF27_DR00170 [Candidatus Jidaibacter acanthamoeba]